MGMGFALVCPPDEVRAVLSVYGEGARVVGTVIPGEGVTVPSLDIRYDKY